jgi:hypothetical protein
MTIPRRLDSGPARLRGRWLSVQEPSGRGGYARPRVIFARQVLSCLVLQLVLSGKLGVAEVTVQIFTGIGVIGSIRVPLALGRDDQARRNRPEWYQTSRFTPADRAGTLRFFCWRGIVMTILTRLVTLCIHNRPQFAHLPADAKCADTNINYLVRGIPLFRCYR